MLNNVTVEHFDYNIVFICCDFKWLLCHFCSGLQRINHVNLFRLLSNFRSYPSTKTITKSLLQSHQQGQNIITVTLQQQKGYTQHGYNWWRTVRTDEQKYTLLNHCPDTTGSNSIDNCKRFQQKVKITMHKDTLIAILNNQQTLGWPPLHNIWRTKQRIKTY